ncbi:MAG: amidase [Deltaproteobacteria bacterium]|nr:amidase [Deltaproteobacteria bacterium]
MFDVAGYRVCAGNPDWLRTHAPAEKTAPAVQTLLDAGATLVGKTLTDELAFSMSGENIHYGTPVNPAAPDRIPGGSSSGSASATASKLVDFALGTDTSGSIRVPASYCGLFSMRPTHARISCQGVVPLAPSFDTVGWFARDASLLQRVGEVLLAEHPPSTLPTRLLIADDAFALVEESSRVSLQRVVAQIATRTQAVEHIKLCQTSLETWHAMELVLKEYEVWQTHGPWIRSVQPKLAPDIEKRFLRAATVTADKNAEAQRQRIALRAAVLDRLGEDVVLCLPTAPGIAPVKNTPSDTIERTRRTTLTLTCLAGLAGLPQVTLPLAQVAQCPIGISFITAPGRDTALLSYAQQVSKSSLG